MYTEPDDEPTTGKMILILCISFLAWALYCIAQLWA